MFWNFTVTAQEVIVTVFAIGLCPLLLWGPVLGMLCNVLLEETCTMQGL